MRDPFLALVSLKDGSELWSLPLKAKAVKWGIAVDHRSRIVVSQENGVVACYTAADAGKYPKGRWAGTAPQALRRKTLVPAAESSMMMVP